MPQKSKAPQSKAPPEDAFANLEQAAYRQDQEEKAKQNIIEARVKLVLDREAKGAFFATLALRLTPSPNWDIETMMTDGKRLEYNPGFVNDMPLAERVGVVTHEVLHNALCHHTRRGVRQIRRWNLAADLAVNPTLLEAGYRLPPSRVVPGEGKYKQFPLGKSVEEYYSLLEEDGDGQQPEGDQDGEGDGAGGQGNDPGGCGTTQAPGDGSQAAISEAEAETAVAVGQAHQAAKGRGKLPGSLERLVGEVLQPKVDWRAVLREFVSRLAKSDYSWNPPNRRFLHDDLYLPGLRSEELGQVVVAVDTSGSINQETLLVFASEMQGILDTFGDVELTILYHDSDIRHEQRWRTSDGPLVLEAKGGGGTSHVPVFERVNNAPEQPVCMVCLTDLHTDLPAEVPDYPVLWAVVGNAKPQAHFGQIVEVGA